VHDAGTADTREPLDRRTAWLVLAAATAALAALAGWLVPWDWLPGATLHPVPPGEVLSAREIARAEDYSSHVRLLSQLSYVVTLAVALVLGLSPLGARLVARLPGRWWVQVALATFGVTALERVLTLPLALAVRRRNLDEGLTRQALGPFLVDRAYSLLVTWVVTALLVLLVVGTARRWPRRWFLVAGVGGALLTFMVSLLYPLLVEPLFNRFTPLPDGPLRTSILRLADEVGVEVQDVLVADASRRTTTLNAYVSGYGGTRRIVVYDTLLAQLDGDEVRSVVAHELGHARNQDVLLGTGLGALGVLAGTAALALLLDAGPLRRRAGVEGPDDPRAVPLILALAAVGAFLASPAQNVVSRAVEARADRVALEVTQDRPAFERLQRALTRRSLADPTPPTYSYLWFASHPTVVQRLGIAAALLPDQPPGAGGGAGAAR
jgi:STE24 endopeptidase